jgi:monoamine oxidase
MSKTPLISLLRHACKIAQNSRQTGIPADEIIDMLPEKMTRRQWLRGGLLVTGAVAGASLSPRPSYAATNTKVLIVGAGIAGLTAAYRLTQAGVPVDIIEARKSVGGRMKSLVNAAGGDISIELGGEFIDTPHQSIRRLASELGLELADATATDRGLTEQTYHFDGRNLSLAEIVADFAPLIPIIDRDFRVFVSLDSPAAQALDRMSITEYLDRQPIDPRLKKLLAMTYTLLNGSEASMQSSLNLIGLIGTDITKFELYGDCDERYHIIGGNARLPQRLAERLTNAIETETELEAIKQLSDGRYRVSLRSLYGSCDRKYDRILVTIPFIVLRNVRLDVDLPPLTRKTIDELGYGTNSKLITAYRERIWRTRHRSNGMVFSDLFGSQTWEATRYTTASGGFLTNFTGGIQGMQAGVSTLETQVEKLLPQLDHIFPGMREQYRGKAFRAYWTGEPFSQGSYSCYLIGQTTQFLGRVGKRVGNLFFAGEHCSVAYWGYMEGACETAEAVAREILADLKLSSQAA